MFFRKKDYYIYKLEIRGMRCGMCESHINDVVRKNFDCFKVKSNHFKNETVIYSKNSLDQEKLKEDINKTGYELGNIEVAREGK